MVTNLHHLADALLDAWNGHDMDRILYLYAPDHRGEDVSQASPIQGHPGIARAVSAIFLAFPDLSFTNEELIIQDNRLAIAWVMRGTHQGTVMNIPPTQRPIRVRGSSFFTVNNGKIARSLHIWDVAGLLRAIGLLPDL
jgi:steroid delta-isomerase-like uncharacterized protein